MKSATRKCLLLLLHMCSVGNTPPLIWICSCVCLATSTVYTGTRAHARCVGRVGRLQLSVMWKHLTWMEDDCCMYLDTHNNCRLINFTCTGADVHDPEESKAASACVTFTSAHIHAHTSTHTRTPQMILHAPITCTTVCILRCSCHVMLYPCV